MDTQITARHFSVTPQLKDFVVTRISKLERFYNGITGARVILSRHNASNRDKAAEITLSVYKQSLTAQVQAQSYEEAVDMCVMRLRRQVLRYKAKIRGG